MLESGDYSWCLFAGHLVLEKMLKAFYVKVREEIPPRTHNLLALAGSVDLNLTQKQEEFLSRVNDFSIEARYPDFEGQFYESCTKEFASENLTKVREFYQWLKSLMK
ncbi:HEPN domain-containing protein [Candidatus Poribacteria bacterium]